MQNREPATRAVLGTFLVSGCLFWAASCDTSQGLRLVRDAGLSGGNGSGGATGQPSQTPTDDGKVVGTGGTLSLPRTGGQSGGTPVPTGGRGGSATAVAGSAGGVGLGTDGGIAIGGTQSIGTAGAIGGAPSSGGVASSGSAFSTGGAVAVAPATVAESGFVTVSTGTVQLSGYIASSTAGSGSSIALTYGTDEFCATGVVAPNSTYKSWASTGFNVNQQASGASGSTQSLALVGTTISLRYVNRGGATLEFQLFDGSQYWCYYLPPAPESTTFSFPLASLNTQCWDGKGTAFQSGTPIVSVNLAVPGASNSKTSFDYCFQGMSVN